MDFLIIGGTEKAGTTALFNFFYNHPSVIPSIQKETDYFRNNDSNSISNYLLEFPQHRKDGTYFEASPGYLAASSTVIPNIQKTLKGHNTRIVFILRDPVERFISNFNFLKSRGFIDNNLIFKDYLDSAIRYRKNNIVSNNISQWALDSVFHGEYAPHIEQYIAHFNQAVMLVCYDDFKSSPHAIVSDICNFAELDSTYFQNFEFFTSNTTFNPKNQFIQRQLIKINDFFSPVFFKYPKLKNRLVSIYKQLNQEQREKINPATVEQLIELYRPSVLQLIELLKKHERPSPNWTRKYI